VRVAMKLWWGTRNWDCSCDSRVKGRKVERVVRRRITDMQLSFMKILTMNSEVARRKCQWVEFLINREDIGADQHAFVMTFGESGGAGCRDDPADRGSVEDSAPFFRRRLLL
jgi:hypothetical protein